MKKRLSATWRALTSLWWQFLLWIDQGANFAGLGLKALVMAAITGQEQAICYADETLSAHAWRAEQARKPWARVMRPVIDAGFFWQAQDPAVNAAAGFPVKGHCQRAFWKKKLRLGLPEEYRDLPATKAPANQE